MARCAILLALPLLAACLQPSVAPKAPKLDRARTIVLGERLDVAGVLANELTHRGYAARPIASTEAARADLRPRLDALRAVLTALPGRRSTGAGLGSAPLALAREFDVEVIVHARRVPRSSKLEVAIVDGRTGALVWRQSRDEGDDSGAALAALASSLPYAATSRRASTTVATTAKDT